MTRFLCTLLVYQIFIVAAKECFFHAYRKIDLGKRDDGDPGDPLLLTPYVESGNIEEGRRLALVSFTEGLRINSFAGFFTVNKTYESNQFFWYFPAMVPNNRHAPVVVWLQGGPGASVLLGLFLENGPLIVQKNKFKMRKYHWALNHHLIYIDNPVGTGFSFTNDSRGYCTDDTQVGAQLYSTLLQFFQLFPKLQQNNFFVAGESYGGKFAATLVYTIHKNNPTADIKINIKGIAIGNGFIDPEHQLFYGKYLNQIGLIDWTQAKIFEFYENKTIDFIKRNDYGKAFVTFNILVGGGFYNGKGVFNNLTGFHYFMNFLHSKDNKDYRHVGAVLQKSTFRKTIHVGNLTFHGGAEVIEHLKYDLLKSVAPCIADLLKHYNVVLYNGQLDIIVPQPLTVNIIKNLRFPGAEKYKTANRYIWKVDGEVAGYIKQAGKLIEIMVRNAGHMVPGDQPKWALDLITRFTHEKTFLGPKVFNLTPLDQL